MGARKPGPLKEAIDAAAKGVIVRMLAATNGDVGRAAKNSGVNRTHFYTLMKRYGIVIERQTVARVKQIQRSQGERP